MGKPGPKASNIFQKLKLGNNSVKSMPKHDTSPVKFDKTDSEAAYGGGKGLADPAGAVKSAMKKALVGNQNRLPEELKSKIKAAPESPAKMSPLMGALATGAAMGGASKVAEKVIGPSKKLKTPAKKLSAAEKRAKALAKGDPKKEARLLEAAEKQQAAIDGRKAPVKKYKTMAKKHKTVAYKYKHKK